MAINLVRYPIQQMEVYCLKERGELMSVVNIMNTYCFNCLSCPHMGAHCPTPQLSMFRVLLNFCKGHPSSLLSVKEVGEESPWELGFAVVLKKCDRRYTVRYIMTHHPTTSTASRA